MDNNLTDIEKTEIISEYLFDIHRNNLRNDHILDLVAIASYTMTKLTYRLTTDGKN